MKRVRVQQRSRLSRPSVSFFSSGCALLDCVLGGGYAERRVINIVGDESSGKTLLATEAARNFQHKHQRGFVEYADCEGTFDEFYAEMIGLHLDQRCFKKQTELETVEDLYKRLDSVCKAQERRQRPRPYLFVIDSLDSLSDVAEQQTDFDKRTIDRKAAQMSRLFRKLRTRLAQCNITLMVVSQTRAKIGPTFGGSYSISGGKALRFYSSQRLYLSERQKLTSTHKKVKRPTGVLVSAYCNKNKVGLPFRACVFPIVFNYGIDDIQAHASYLRALGRLRPLVGYSNVAGVKKKADALRGKSLLLFRERLADAVRETWHSVETSFLPKRGKYQ